MVRVGSTFHRYEGTSPHLYVVIAVEEFDDLLITVNFTTIYRNTVVDEACKVNVGDHSFFTRASYVYYRGAAVQSITHVEAEIATYDSADTDVSTTLLRRIREGAEKTAYIPFGVKSRLDRMLALEQKNAVANQSGMGDA